MLQDSAASSLQSETSLAMEMVLAQLVPEFKDAAAYNTTFCHRVTITHAVGIYFLQ